MEDIVITIQDSTLKAKVESLLEKHDIVFSLTAPTAESPFPLWVWHDVMKLWIGDRWLNVGTYNGPKTTDTRIGNGLIRIKS